MINNQFSLKNKKIIILGGGRLTATDIEVPGDISSAAFFMVAAAISENSEIHLKQVGLNSTRTGIISLLKLMNAKLQISNERVVGGEPIEPADKITSLLAFTVINSLFFQ